MELDIVGMKTAVGVLSAVRLTQITEGIGRERKKFRVKLKWNERKVPNPKAAHANVFSMAANKIDKSKVCLECNQTFDRCDNLSKFCSHSCAGKYNNRRLYPSKEIVVKDEKGKDKLVRSNTCIFCSSPCGKNQYCNWKCKRNMRIENCSYRR